jgi:hypothetical protein
MSPVVLYGCGTWSFPVMDELRLRVFENRILRRIFEPKEAVPMRQGKPGPNYVAYIFVFLGSSIICRLYK